MPNRMHLLMTHTRLPVLALAAESFARTLDDNYSYSRGPARTGRPDSRTGRPRSTPGEFAQEQTGLLRSAIFFDEEGGFSGPWTRYKVGLNVDESVNPSALREYLMYIEGYQKVTASRYGLTMTAESAETHVVMLRYLQQHLDPQRFSVPG